jgi:hypothetical protein
MHPPKEKEKEKEKEKKGRLSRKKSGFPSRIGQNQTYFSE